MTSAPINSLAAYLPTSRVFRVEDDRELVYVLNSSYTDIANSVNVREIALYDQLEGLTGQQFFSADPMVKRQTYRTVYSIGAIAAGATLNTAHGLVGVTAFTRIYGTCVTDVVDYRPIPYVSVAATNQQVQIRVLGANIEIINGAAAANITSGIVVLEYLKN